MQEKRRRRGNPELDAPAPLKDARSEETRSSVAGKLEYAATGETLAALES
jgi:hypothetical protein